MIQNTLPMPEQPSQTLTEKIAAVRRGFHKEAHRRVSFERVLLNYHNRLHNSDTTTQEYIAKTLNTLHQVLNQPNLVAPHILIDSVTEIIRFVGEVGLGFEFVGNFVDRIMQVYQQEGYSLTALYLLKARYLPVHGIEHIEREKVFLEARRYMEETGDQEGQVLILLELAEYYTVVSAYKKSINVCKECEQLIRLNSTLQQYYSLVWTDLGMNYFPLYDFDRARHCFLQAEVLLQNERNDHQAQGKRSHGKRVLSNVLHYLGRDAQVRGDFGIAMQYYGEAHRYQQLGLDDTGAIAFYHLRIGELLMLVSLYAQARDHFTICQELIHTTVVVGTARIQLRSAWATLYETEGNYAKAKECIMGALAEARKNNTSRMELGCLLKLFGLETRHFRLHCAAHAAFQIMKTWQNGELRKAGILTFLRRLRNYLQILWRRGKHKSSLLTCMCPMHLVHHVGTAYKGNEEKTYSLLEENLLPKNIVLP